MNNLKILSLEDDGDLAVVMSHYFEGEGHDLTQIATGQKCLEIIQSHNFDVLLMDLGLPDMDGLTLIPQIKQHYQGPIIIVSGKSDTTDRIVGLEIGADDYIVKPFEMRELLARIKANVRRQAQLTQDNTPTENQDLFIFEFNDFVFNESKLTLKHNKLGDIAITSGECQLLQIFLVSKGRALTREYLHEQTRNNNYEVFDRAVDITITRLRKKLDDNPQNPTIIKTIHGIGYMFIAEIKKVRSIKIGL